MHKIKQLGIATWLVVCSTQAFSLDLHDKQLQGSQLGNSTQLGKAEPKESQLKQPSSSTPTDNSSLEDHNHSPENNSEFSYPNLRNSLKQKGSMELGAALAEIGRGDLIGDGIAENSFDRGTFEIPIRGIFTELMFEDSLDERPIPFRPRLRKP